MTHDDCKHNNYRIFLFVLIYICFMSKTRPKQVFNWSSATKSRPVCASKQMHLGKLSLCSLDRISRARLRSELSSSTRPFFQSATNTHPSTPKAKWNGSSANVCSQYFTGLRWFVMQYIQRVVSTAGTHASNVIHIMDLWGNICLCWPPAPETQC